MSTKNPKSLFLIDGIGAVVSAFLLGVVLVKFESIFGIPRSALYILAILPCFFAVYDFYCYFKIQNNIGSFLKAIAIVNILYCCLSLAFAIYHYQLILTLGWLYIIVEICIVLALAFIELKVAKSEGA